MKCSTYIAYNLKIKLFCYANRINGKFFSIMNFKINIADQVISKTIVLQKGTI